MTRTARTRAWLELLSSMRFAISLLTVLAIASIIGTVVKQNEPFNNYLNQFGPFWFPVFETLGLYAVYNTGWFLVLLAFLVGSTSVCLVRQGPQMLREMRSYRTHAREASLRQFAHRETFATALPAAEIALRVSDWLATQGFRAKQDVRDDGLLIAAKAGSATRLGYFLAHGAIVVICIGGLLDGNLPLKLTLWLAGKTPTTAAVLGTRIPPESRLDTRTLSFRGNVFVAEGGSTQLATLNVDDGVLVQDLPFKLALKKFTIEHYTTGAPKRFASEVVLTDESGKQSEHVIEVNHPVSFAGLTIYQSSFDDGGSQLELQPHAFGRSAPLPALSGTVGAGLPFKPYTLELTAFRAFNIENMSEDKPAATLSSKLGSAARAQDKKDLRNVGPSFQFKLRDEAGQAREYQNYMLPITQEGRAFMLSGMRGAPDEPFRYLRIPVDEEGRIETFFALRAALTDPAQRHEIATHFARAAIKNADAATTARLTETAERTLMLFATRGFEAIGRFIEQTVPMDERDKASDIFVKILQGAAWDAWQMLREQHALPPLTLNEARAQYVRDALFAASDAFSYGAPVYVQLTGFKEVRASVFQVTRSPGQPLVFFGSLLLVLGVTCMLYIRERRAFVLIQPGEVLFAMSANRKTLDFDTAFRRHCDQLRKLLA